MKRNSLKLSEMTNELNQLLKSNIVFFIFIWTGSFSFQRDQALRPSFPWAIFNLIVLIILVKEIKKVKRAYLFHVIIYIMSLSVAAMILSGTVWFIFEKGEFDNKSIWFIAASTTVTLLSFWSELRTVRSALRSSLTQIIKAGRLNLQEGQWNLSAELKLNSWKPDNINQLAKLSPIVTALGFALARSIEGGVQMYLFGICLYVFSFVIIWGYTKHLAIALQLREWEILHNIKINL
jgi:hypothetical protein